MESLVNLMKNSIAFPAILVLVLVGVIANRYNFSIINYIADRAIERANLAYTPYGPNNVPPQMIQQPPQVQSSGS